MSSKPSRFGDKLNTILSAWAQFAPDTKLAGMTLAEFKTAVGESLESRAQIADRRLELKGLIARRAAGDIIGREVVARVVAGVLAEATLGPNSGFYRAMNYVPKSERASGLTRKGEGTAPDESITPAPSTN